MSEGAEVEGVGGGLERASGRALALNLARQLRGLALLLEQCGLRGLCPRHHLCQHAGRFVCSGPGFLQRHL